LISGSVQAGDGLFGADFSELTGEVSTEVTLFPEDAQFSGQRRNSVSFSIKPEATLEWDSIELLGGAGATFSLIPFLRVDTIDDERTHFDLREAKFDFRFGETDVTIGNDIVFWGKTEVDQIVDIVNTVDGVEGTDGEDKLGQPMVAVRRLVDIGDFSGQAAAFYFPYFREQTFLGEESRFRSAIVIDGGLSRDPAFEVNETAQVPIGGGQFVDVPTSLRPVYGRITQVGFDGQYTRDATLFKLEAIGRFDQRNLSFEEEDYFSVIGGVEHTLFVCL